MNQTISFIISVFNQLKLTPDVGNRDNDKTKLQSLTDTTRRELHEGKS